MPSTVSLDSVAVPRRRRSRASTSSELPHWSEVDGERRRERPSPTVAGILSDLVSWAADIAVLITRGCPEDREAIDRVRHYALSWLANEPCPGVEIDDSFVIQQFAGSVRRADSVRDFLGATSNEDRIEIEPQLVGDALREIDDCHDFLIRADIDDFPSNIRPECHFL